MRYLLFIAPTILIAGAALAAPPSIVQSCKQDDGSRIVVLAESASNGSRFYLQVNGRIDKAFTDFPDADFVGEIVLAACVEHVLVFAIKYGPPYLKGVAIRKNPVNRKIERIDFAEKALPHWLYVSPTEMKLIVPNIGHEVSSQYLLYSFNPTTGQPAEAEAVDNRPDKHGFKVARLKGRQTR